MTARQVDDLRNIGASIQAIGIVDGRRDEAVYAERRMAGIHTCGLILATSGEDQEQMRNALDALGLLSSLRGES